GFAKRFHGNGHLGGPNLAWIVLNPTGLRINLRKFALRDAANSAVVIEHNRTRAGGPLVKRKHVWQVGLLLRSEHHCKPGGRDFSISSSTRTSGLSSCRTPFSRLFRRNLGACFSRFTEADGNRLLRILYFPTLAAAARFQLAMLVLMHHFCHFLLRRACRLLCARALFRGCLFRGHLYSPFLGLRAPERNMFQKIRARFDG